jgi:hypothetical protein
MIERPFTTPASTARQALATQRKEFMQRIGA